MRDPLTTSPVSTWSIAELQPGVAVELWLNGTGAMDVLKLVEAERQRSAKADAPSTSRTPPARSAKPAMS